MNTTKKGDKLEEKIFELFDDEISKGRFFAQKDFCRIYTKKGYYSKDRQKDIIFDLSIEIFLPDQETYSLLVLIECKNYNHKVPVDDVEEFFSKTQQISGANVKAILVSNNAFQEGTFKYSKSKGIGLLRYYDKSNLNWILTRSPSSLLSSNYAINESSNAYNGLHIETFESNNFDCYGFIDGQYTNSLRLFISALIKHEIDKDFNESLSTIETVNESNTTLVKYIEESEIEIVCNSILKKINFNNGEVPLKKICQFLMENHNLKVFFNIQLNDGVLGKITFNPLEIHIDSKQCETPERERFTLAHELGHFLLEHSKYMLGEQCHKSDINLVEPVNVGIKDIMRMEWQANQFASCLLLPKIEFVRTFLTIAAKIELSNKGFGLIS